MKTVYAIYRIEYDYYGDSLDECLTRLVDDETAARNWMGSRDIEIPDILCTADSDLEYLKCLEWEDDTNPLDSYYFIRPLFLYSKEDLNG